MQQARATQRQTSLQQGAASVVVGAPLPVESPAAPAPSAGRIVGGATTTDSSPSTFRPVVEVRTRGTWDGDGSLPDQYSRAPLKLAEPNTGTIASAAFPAQTGRAPLHTARPVDARRPHGGAPPLPGPGQGATSTACDADAEPNPDNRRRHADLNAWLDARLPLSRSITLEAAVESCRVRFPRLSRPTIRREIDIASRYGGPYIYGIRKHDGALMIGRRPARMLQRERSSKVLKSAIVAKQQERAAQ